MKNLHALIILLSFSCLLSFGQNYDDDVTPRYDAYRARLADSVLSGGGDGLETDPVWTSEKSDYYTKAQTDQNISDSIAESGESDPVYTNDSSEIVKFRDTNVVATKNYVVESLPDSTWDSLSVIGNMSVGTPTSNGRLYSSRITLGDKDGSTTDKMLELLGDDSGGDFSCYIASHTSTHNTFALHMADYDGTEDSNSSVGLQWGKNSDDDPVFQFGPTKSTRWGKLRNEGDGYNNFFRIGLDENLNQWKASDAVMFRIEKYKGYGGQTGKLMLIDDEDNDFFEVHSNGYFGATNELGGQTYGMQCDPTGNLNTDNGYAFEVFGGYDGMQFNTFQGEINFDYGEDGVKNLLINSSGVNVNLAGVSDAFSVSRDGHLIETQTSSNLVGLEFTRFSNTLDLGLDYSNGYSYIEHGPSGDFIHLNDDGTIDINTDVLGISNHLNISSDFQHTQFYGGALSIKNTNSTGVGTSQAIYAESSGDNSTIVATGDPSSLPVILMYHDTRATNSNSGKLFLGGVTGEYSTLAMYSDGSYGVGPGGNNGRDVYLFREEANTFSIADDAWTPTEGHLKMYGTIRNDHLEIGEELGLTGGTGDKGYLLFNKDRGVNRRMSTIIGNDGGLYLGTVENYDIIDIDDDPNEVIIKSGFPLIVEDSLKVEGLIKNKPPHYRAYSDSLIDEEITINSQNQWEMVTTSVDTLFVTSESVNMGSCNCGDSVKLGNDGDWNFYGKLTLETRVNNRIQLGFYNVTQDEYLEGYAFGLGEGNDDWIDIHGKFYCNGCFAGDKIIMVVRNLTDSDNITIKSATWWVDFNHY